MYKRLVTFGCSLTYGQGLADCHIPPHSSGPHPSKFAWPKILANKLNLECVNLSKPGASNKEIWKIILDTQLYSDDLVIIHWSHFDRWCIIEEQFIKKIGVWKTKKHMPSKAFFKYIHSEYDMQTDLNCRSDHIERYLTDLEITHYHLVTKEKDIENIARWNSSRFLPIYTSRIRKNFPTALDGSHPGTAAHQELADQIYRNIHDNT